MSSRSSEVAWVDRAVALAIHDEQLGEHGGAAGIRDEGALDSALARPRNRAVYGDADLHGLAAAYAFGICRNHPFVDGNKRTSFVITELFLALNGRSLDADDAAVVTTWLAIADGRMTEEDVAGWLRRSDRDGAAAG